MDQNQLNNLRNIAQAAHNLEANRIARETAAATNELLRSQEQQRALEHQRLVAEQQRVAVEQQRLQEEQRRTQLAAQEQQRRIQLAESEANERKALAERVKSMRVKMAALEEEIADFRSSLSQIGGNPPLIGGVPIATYTFLLLQRKLEKLVALKGDLHELSDIRFIGQLEKSVRELREAFPQIYGDSPVKGALRYLKDLAGWPARSVSHAGKDIHPSRLVQEVRKANEGFLEIFEKAETEIASSAVISRLFSEITTQEQLLDDAEAAFTKEWTSVEPLIKDLGSVGVGPVEVQDLAGASFPHLVEQTDPISRLRQCLKIFRRALNKIKKYRQEDSTNIQDARYHLTEGHLFEAKLALETIKWKTWKDVYVVSAHEEFQIAQDEELRRLIEETALLAKSDEFEALRRISTNAKDLTSLDKLFYGLFERRKCLLRDLKKKLFAEISDLESQDRQRAQNHAEFLLKKAEGVAELQVSLFERIETIRVAINCQLIKRKASFAVIAQVAFVAICIFCVFMLFRLDFLEETLGIKISYNLSIIIGGSMGSATIFGLIFINNRLEKATAEKSALLVESHKLIREFQSKKSVEFLHPQPPRKFFVENQSALLKKLSKKISVLGGTKPGAVFANRMRKRFRWCPPGEFMMGSTEEEQAYATKSDVGGLFQWEKREKMLITRGFWISECPVTQNEYKKVMGRSYKEHSASVGVPWQQIVEGGDVPMTQISFRDAVKFCQRLTALEIGNGTLPHGWAYRLPTDVQWEYACRAGTQTAVYTGGIEVLAKNNIPQLDSIAWYSGNSSVEFYGVRGWNTSGWEGKQYPNGLAGPRDVRVKMPNPWGIYDMLGNVWEWCDDRGCDINDHESKKKKVLRGGSWSSLAYCCRSACRTLQAGGARCSAFGFRVALVPVNN